MSRTMREVFNFKSTCTVYVAIKRLLDRVFKKNALLRLFH